MLKITSEISDGTVTAYVEGRVDSSNAAEFEKLLSEADKGENLIIDIKKLEYISSAGLRVFLRLRKKHSDLFLRSANTEVYEILDMTGFTEMLRVTRAYRRVSVDGCEVIGQGANGLVYRIDGDTVVKVYKNADSLGDIVHERELAKKALLLGIPTAISYDVVEVGDRYASMFEMINARSISQRLAADPASLDENAGKYVELLKLIHSTEVPEGQLPSQLDEAKKWVSAAEGLLPADVYAKIKSMVDAIPEDDHMIHGDYHIKNVMIQNDETILIDMDTISVGNPILEMASIYNAFVGYGLFTPGECEKFLGIDHSLVIPFYKKSMQLYYGTEDEAYLDMMEQRAKLIGLLRILRRSVRVKKPQELIDAYREEIIRTAEKVDTLI